MAAEEPLTALIPHIRPARKFRRTAWQPGQVTGDIVPGQQGGAVSSLESRAMADAYMPDIGDAAPPTRPMEGGSEEVYGDMQPAGGQQESPFMFASQGSAGVRYRQQCDKNGCRMVPDLGGMAGQPAMAPSLPPGVTVGPGEKYVEGSLREVLPKASAPPAAAAPATAPPAQAQGGGRKPVTQSLEEAKLLARSLYEPAIQSYQAMATAPDNKTALSYRLAGDAHMRVGELAMQQINAEELNRQADLVEKQAQQLLDLKDPVIRQQKDEEVVAAIRSGDGTVRSRAEDVIRFKMRGMPDNMELSAGDWEKMVQLEQGIVTARDVAKNMEAARALQRRLQESPPQTKEQEHQANILKWQFANDTRVRLRDRYVAMANPDDLRRTMADELGKVYYNAAASDLKARGVSGDELEFTALQQAQIALDTAFRSVLDMQKGNPAQLPMPTPPQLSRPAADSDKTSIEPAAVQEQKSPWWSALESLTSSPW